MQHDQVEVCLKSGSRWKVKHRDQYNFIIWGICLSDKVEDNSIFIDSYSNKVSLDKVIEMRSI